MADYSSNEEGYKRVTAYEVPVSVVMPCYNAAKTVKTAIDSVLSQGLDLELIVVNDCSKDNTAQVLQEYAADPRVIIVENTEQLGAAGSRNRAVSMARGEYVAFLDSDDYWAEGKLIAQMDLLKKTGCVLCCTGRELMQPDGQLTGRIIHVKEQVTYEELLKHNSINCSSVVIKREAIRAFPMEHEDSHEDYITWLKVLRIYGPAVGIDEPMLKYRLSATGKSGSKFKSARMTYKVYGYMGFGKIKSLRCFISYALHGVWKYLRA